MATYSPACHAPKKLGLIDVKIAVPFTGTLLQLGHAMDYINIDERHFFHDVPGDRHGGPAGPPIETQYLGTIMHVGVTLTSWNASNMATLIGMGLFATSGTILQTEVGEFMLTARSMRLLLHTSDANDTLNFWCALMREPKRLAAGTKNSEYVLSWECHRPPCGHAKAGILWDRNSDAYA